MVTYATRNDTQWLLVILAHLAEWDITLVSMTTVDEHTVHLTLNAAIVDPEQVEHLELTEVG